MFERRDASFQESIEFDEKISETRPIFGLDRQEAVFPVNQLPVEILIAVISFGSSGRPLLKIPSRCIRFSWVCRHWRLVIVNNAAFWKSIILDSRMTPSFFQELLIRSKTGPLEIMVENWDPILPFIYDLRAEAKAGRVVKTLYTKFPAAFSALHPFLPSLENIFCDHGYPTDISFKTLRKWPHLKALQMYIMNTDGLEMAGRFRELRWLDLTYTVSTPVVSLVEALQTLPNLQVLHLFPSTTPPYLPSNITSPIATFHELKVLFTSCRSLLHLINAPKLTYFDAFVDVDLDDQKYDHFCGFNFSRITHICSTLGSELTFVMGKNTSNGPENISHFPFNRCRTTVGSIFDELPTSYPDHFHYSIDEGRHAPTPLIACVKKATNLVEIVLNLFEPSEYEEEIDDFFKALSGATSVRTLTILSGECIQVVCEPLADGNICPNLERLSYCGAYSTCGRNDHQTSSFLYTCIRNMMETRYASRSRPLDIEIQGFDPVQPGELEELEKLGVRLNQKERTPESFNQENYFTELDD